MDQQDPWQSDQTSYKLFRLYAEQRIFKLRAIVLKKKKKKNSLVCHFPVQ